MTYTVFDALTQKFAAIESELNQLDSAIGDGDHGTTMLRGLQAVQAAPHLPAAKTFRRAAGGASGSLFSQLFVAIEKITDGQSDIGLPLAQAADLIHQIGQAVAGDKTMLDALIPASRTNTLRDAAEAARRGAQATKDMQARRGRARYVEGAGVGHVDAGAMSVAQMLDVVAEYMHTTH